MRTVAIASALGLGMVVLGAREATPFCLKLDGFCDCLNVAAVRDQVANGQLRRYFGTWVNQDCAGTSSPMQGANRSFAGEQNAALGLIGVNWNFTFVDLKQECFFDLDEYYGLAKPPIKNKIQDDKSCTFVDQSCNDDCFGATGPPSSQQPVDR
jgi:hypothetical protein